MNLAIALGVGLVLSYLLTLILSNRLAGPIVRLREHFRKISEGGNLEPVYFRQKDFFNDLPPLINDALKKVSRGEKQKR